MHFSHDLNSGIETFISGVEKAQKVEDSRKPGGQAPKSCAAAVLLMMPDKRGKWRIQPQSHALKRAALCISALSPSTEILPKTWRTSADFRSSREKYLLEHAEINNCSEEFSLPHQVMAHSECQQNYSNNLHGLSAGTCSPHLQSRTDIPHR